MKDLMKKIFVVAMIATLSLCMFVGCGSDQEEEQQGGEEVQTVQFAAFTAYPPYCYLDENGEPAGYEFAVIKAVDELLPQYEIVLNGDGDNALLGIDSGRYDIVSCQYEYSEERAEKYLYPKESINTYRTYMLVPADNDTYQTWEDLAGKRIVTGGENNYGYHILQKYNEEHPDTQFILPNEKATTDETVTGILTGAYDACTGTLDTVARVNEQYGVDGKPVLRVLEEDRPISSSHAYYIFSKDNPELQEAVDGALVQLKESGALADLAVEWIGFDFSSPVGE